MYPGVPVDIAKVDVDAAFRRIDDAPDDAGLFGVDLLWDPSPAGWFLPPATPMDKDVG